MLSSQPIRIYSLHLPYCPPHSGTNTVASLNHVFSQTLFENFNTPLTFTLPSTVVYGVPNSLAESLRVYEAIALLLVDLLPSHSWYSTPKTNFRPPLKSITINYNYTHAIIQVTLLMTVLLFTSKRLSTTTQIPDTELTLFKLLASRSHSLLAADSLLPQSTGI